MVERTKLAIDTSRAIKPMIDSGAFSAWRSNQTIPLDDYCDFILINEDWIGSYVAMDVIMPHDPETAAKASMVNFKYMRNRGLNPIPVYHAFENIDWLKRYLDLGCEYIGISASSLPHVNDGAAERFYDQVWLQLTNVSGDPVVRTHVFGEGRLKAVRQYPWASADSASWLYHAQRSGKFHVPGISQQIAFSQRGHTSTRELDNYDDYSRALIDEIFKKHGIALNSFDRGQKLRRIYMLRTYLTCLAFLEAERKLSATRPIKFRPANLVVPRGNERPGIILNGVALYLVLGGNTAAAVCFAKAGGKHALVSYAHIRQFYNKYRNLRNFARDPMHWTTNDSAAHNDWQALREVLDEGGISGDTSEAVCTNGGQTSPKQLLPIAGNRRGNSPRMRQLRHVGDAGRPGV